MYLQSQGEIETFKANVEGYYDINYGDIVLAQDEVIMQVYDRVGDTVHCDIYTKDPEYSTPIAKDAVVNYRHFNVLNEIEENYFDGKI